MSKKKDLQDKVININGLSLFVLDEDGEFKKVKVDVIPDDEHVVFKSESGDLYFYEPTQGVVISMDELRRVQNFVDEAEAEADDEDEDDSSTESMLFVDDITIH